MTKKLAVLFLTLCAMLLLIPSAFAAETDSGTCGENLTWVLTDDGTLTISGTGEMEDYSSGSAPWYAYRTTIEQVVIDNGVTSIGNYAFSYCSSLTDIVFPESLTSIGTGVFYGCSSLTDIALPEGLTTIGDYAFYCCTSLTSIEIPEGVTNIGKKVFFGCRSLLNIHVALNNIYYSSDANGVLYNKEKTVIIAVPAAIKNFSIPSGVTSISDYAFCYSSLTSIEIPEGVTSIGDYAFYYSSLDSVKILDGLTSIGNYAFYCSSLISIELPKGVTNIGNYTFSHCSRLTDIKFLNGLTSIGDYAFEHCSSLTSIELPEGLTCIGECAFYYCEKISSIEIPDSVTTIGDFAFYYCTSLTSAELSDSLTSIDTGVFEQCTSLTSIAIPANVTSIGSRSFFRCRRLASVDIPEGVTSIGTCAFYECPCLANIVIPNSVTSIGFGAFVSCYSLTSIAIPANVTSIGSRVFYDCSNLTAIELPISIVYIEDSAFLQCPNLSDVHYHGTAKQWKTVEVGSNNTCLTGATIHYCTVLGQKHAHDWIVREIITQATCTTEGEGAYTCQTCDQTKTEAIAATGHDYKAKVIAPTCTEKGYTLHTCENCGDNYKDTYTATIDHSWDEGVVTTEATFSSTGIRTYTCKICSNTKTEVIPKKIGGYVTDDGSVYWVLENGVLTISGTGEIPDWNSGVDRPWEDYNSSMASIIIEEGITSIGAVSFWGCQNLTSVSIPEGVTSIGSSAFGQCFSLTSITIPASVTSLEEAPFYWCPNLERITVSVGNKNYCSDEFGVLFNKDKTLLIAAPGALTEYTIPKSVTAIGDLAFSFCSLTSIIIPEGVTSVGYDAFENCSSLTNVVIPESITSISSAMFAACFSLTSITIPESVTSIESYAFSDAEGLTSITIPESVTSIGDSAFSSCDSLTDVYYGGSEEQWNAITIGRWNAALTNANIHFRYVFEDGAIYWMQKDGVLTISGTGKMPDWDGGGVAVWYDEDASITSVVIEEGITSIGDFSFWECHDLTTISIPESVTRIGTWAFYHCYSLTSVTIPASVTTIGDSPFYGCFALERISVSAGNKNYCSDEFGVLFNKDKTQLIAAPGALKEYVIPKGVTSIEDLAFVACIELTSITIPEGVTSIGIEAFSHCVSLTNVVIPGSVTMIADSSFNGCFGLTSVTISEGVPCIDPYAFIDCRNLTTVTIPESVTSIGNGAFNSCDSLTDVYYAGSKEQWNAITIGNWNNTLTDANIHFAKVHTHEWDSGKVTTKATCTTDGVKTYTCTGCGATKTEKIAATGHDYKTEVVAPTCTEKGYTLHTCKNCGNSYKDTYTNVTGHSWDSGVVTTAPTGTETGVRTYTCQKCGTTKTETIAVLSNPFTDLVKNSSYYNAVLWAVSEGITTGTDATLFSPKADCTRAQIVTFLWRYAGSPEPTTTEHSFVDIVENSSYYKAVLWAVENGITTGMDDTHFGPKEPCTRAQIVTFLWRYAGRPEPSNRNHSFTDIVAGSSYYDAVLWAVELGITTGADSTHFNPKATCTRAQGMTFLYRYHNTL